VLARRRAALVVLAALVAGCSSSDDPGGGSASSAPASTTTEAPTTTTTVLLPPPVPIDWERCGSGVECGRVVVPVDYADPAGPTLELAVTRRPAGDPANRIGSLLVNPGGPGSSGVRRVQRGFVVSPEVAERFDIVGFDPRGVGASTPITCGASVPAFRATDLAPDSPEEQAALEAAAAAVAAECAATEGERLPHLGTVEVAHDLEVIRRALGEPQVSFVGLSYGTLIGLLWAEAYPESVRAMVLDGVVDPSAAGETTSEEQIDAVDDILEAVDATCAADPGCPVTDAGGVLAAYDAVAHRLETEDVPGDGVGPTQLAYAALYSTYGSEHWPRLWDALADALEGDLDGVASMAKSFTSLVAYAPFALITCLDTGHPVGAEAWRRDAEASARHSSRFGAVLANELLPCAFWPRATFVPHEVEALGTPAILVLGSTGDAATPYDQARRVARTLDDGVLLTIDIDGHVALGDSDCATAAATRYLVDLALPPAGTRCSVPTP
jgi:pimeloyl-ACP methyl ester carboxylesterase